MNEHESRLRIKQLFLDIHREWVREAAQQARDGSNWTRQENMPIEDILMCRISKKGFSTTMEVRYYVQSMEKAEQTESKQDYLRRR
jgi:hypothetical protein